VKACAKHFPGLGAARQDSHEVLPVIDRTAAELMAEDVEPFRQLSRKLPAIMVGHAVYPALDSKPASLSRRIVTGLLREELGFGGVVISDDMEMGAIGDLPAAVRQAVAAGVDLVLVCHTPEKIMAAFEALQRVKVPAESAARVEKFLG
jgi:beta-N-acetylhexosaminidase